MLAEELKIPERFQFIVRLNKWHLDCLGPLGGVERLEGF